MTLLLFRHSKTESRRNRDHDFDRVLTEQGRVDAGAMGSLLSERGPFPKLVLCSDAARARETAEIAFGQAGSMPETRFLPDLYDAEVDDYRRVLAEIDPALDVVMIVGHNPTLEEAVKEWTGTEQKLGTSDIAVLEFEYSGWSQLADEPQAGLTELIRLD
jgi:phosphohistidine phosphatase